MKKAKVIKKRGVAKSKVNLNKQTRISKPTTNVDKVLIDNFISLQQVMTNLSSKFDNLSSQISKLLELFEITAKTIAKRESDPESNKSHHEMIGKLDNLVEQNKTIARGLTLMHDFNSQKRAPPSEFPEEKMHIEEGKFRKFDSPEYEGKI